MMQGTIGAELDRCQRILQDAETIGDDGVIWSRAELMDYFRDAYRQMLATVQPTRRFTVLEVPPRFAWSVTHAHETDFVQNSVPWQWAHETEGGWAVSSRCEIEVLEGVAATGSGSGVTHAWERTYDNPTQQTFRFAVPKDSQRVVKLWYDHKPLLPIGTKALDALGTHWYSLEGEPLAWTNGTQRGHTLEVYQIVTAYTSTYRQIDAITREVPLHGVGRYFSGARTYTWKAQDHQTVPYGVVRRITSPSRQYVPRVTEPLRHPLGRDAWFSSSVQSLLVLETRIPDIGTLLEEDDIALLPPQLSKYLRWGALALAFNRQGEGYDPSMATFFGQRYQRGLRVLQRFQQLARKDRTTQRAPAQHGRGRPAYVRFPPSYPAVRR